MGSARSSGAVPLSPVTSEFDRGCGWYGENDAHDQTAEMYLGASCLIKRGGAHASRVVSPRWASNALHCGQPDTGKHRLTGFVLCVDVWLGRDGVVNRRVVAHIGLKIVPESFGGARCRCVGDGVPAALAYGPGTARPARIAVTQLFLYSATWQTDSRAGGMADPTRKRALRCAVKLRSMST